MRFYILLEQEHIYYYEFEWFLKMLKLTNELIAGKLTMKLFLLYDQI